MFTIGYRTVLHHLSLEGGERVVEAEPYTGTRTRVKQLWHDTFEANPLLSPWAGPYGGTPPFDRVRVADIKPALKPRWRKSWPRSKTSRRNPAAPTFDNTLGQLERSGHAFDRVNAIYDVWASTMNTGAFQAVEREMGPKIAAFHDAVTQNSQLFARIEAVYEENCVSSSGLLTPAQTPAVLGITTPVSCAPAPSSMLPPKLRWETSTSALPACSRISAKISWPTSRNTCCISPTARIWRACRRRSARPRLRRGVGTSGAVGHSQHPLRHGPIPHVRVAAWTCVKESGARTTTAATTAMLMTTRASSPEILALRSERARLLDLRLMPIGGSPTGMAGSPENAMALLMRIWPAAVARVREEVADMQAIADVDAPGIKIEAWGLSLLRRESAPG